MHEINKKSHIYYISDVRHMEHFIRLCRRQWKTRLPDAHEAS